MNLTDGRAILSISKVCFRTMMNKSAKSGDSEKRVRSRLTNGHFSKKETKLFSVGIRASWLFWRPDHWHYYPTYLVKPPLSPLPARRAHFFLLMGGGKSVV